MSYKLLYFHDPMCSWCWAFNPCWKSIVEKLPQHISPYRILGGLAPDTDQLMPMEMQLKLQNIWQKIQLTVPGTEFNFDFWTQCRPRRSTYNACRAVIAARNLDADCEEKMILAIQKAYYLEARNPANISTLIELATEIGQDPTLFSTELNSGAVNQQLMYEIDFTQQRSIKGYPSLQLEQDHQVTDIRLDYNDANKVLKQIKFLTLT